MRGNLNQFRARNSSRMGRPNILTETPQPQKATLGQPGGCATSAATAGVARNAAKARLATVRFTVSNLAMALAVWPVLFRLAAAEKEGFASRITNGVSAMVRLKFIDCFPLWGRDEEIFNAGRYLALPPPLRVKAGQRIHMRAVGRYPVFIVILAMFCALGGVEKNSVSVLMTFKPKAMGFPNDRVPTKPDPSGLEQQISY